ncbi:MAG: DegV family EDD domain-containing protein [Desulfobulbaceae bacterium]|nr:DegV family EDD domain-containing protein [Desulfobulbaceae bacterium]
MTDFSKSFANGYACLAAWSDLLDSINVFPVADGDTGTNLRLSLSPLRDHQQFDRTDTPGLLTSSAIGNSGNIASPFFRHFCSATGVHELAEKASLGREKAWQGIANPCSGTMLSVFDSLVSVLETHDEMTSIYGNLSRELQAAVKSTRQLLPDLQNAGVVDSGALGMYIFFDGFFRELTEQTGESESIFDLFSNSLSINSSFKQETSEDYCVDLLMQVEEQEDVVEESIAGLGESVVVVRDESVLKVHIHTPDPKTLRGQLDNYGDIVHWSDEKIEQKNLHNNHPGEKPYFHIITDGAGSLTREMALDHGISLLDSYIVTGESSRPESLCDPERIYHLMLNGTRLTTAQASTFERHQHYRNLSRQFGRCLYLCVGSAFTGNYEIAKGWKKDNDPNDLFTVIDTGAASGRLALIVLRVSRYNSSSHPPKDLLAIVDKVLGECKEYVFIDELKYLVAGGRVSRAKGFFGDLLHMKPVISPTSSGVEKMGVVRSRKGQLAFAVEVLTENFDGTAAPIVMLQYSDNKEWVESRVQAEMRRLLPQAEILLTPLSLTSGVHMGPGTWSMAFSPPLCSDICS